MLKYACKNRCGNYGRNSQLGITMCSGHHVFVDANAITTILSHLNQWNIRVITAVGEHIHLTKRLLELSEANLSDPMSNEVTSSTRKSRLRPYNREGRT